MTSRQCPRVRRALDLQADAAGKLDRDRRRWRLRAPPHVRRGGNRHRNERSGFARRLACSPPAIQEARSTPALRAISAATAPGSSKAATQRSFSARDQRRRLSTDVMTSMRFMALWITPGIVTVSYGKRRSKRRRSPEAYGACVVVHLSSDRPPSLPALRLRFSSALFEASQVLRSRPTPRSFPDSFVSSTSCRGPGSLMRLRAERGLPGSDAILLYVMWPSTPAERQRLA